MVAQVRMPSSCNRPRLTSTSQDRDEELPDSPYAILRLPRSASAAEVRLAFRAAARECHPDKGGDATRFAAVRAAFEARNRGCSSPPVFFLCLSCAVLHRQVLSDPAQREAFDALGDAQKFRRRVPSCPSYRPEPL